MGEKGKEQEQQRFDVLYVKRRLLGCKMSTRRISIDPFFLKDLIVAGSEIE